MSNCSNNDAAALPRERATCLPSVCVIIPAYNASGTIDDTIQTVLSQSFRGAITIIVIDDGSTDATRDIVSAIRGPIRLLTQKKAGPSRARNYGAKSSLADFVLFLDADDLLPLDFLECLVTAAMRSAADVVCCGWREVTPGGVLLAQHLAPKFENGMFDRLCVSNALAIHCVLVRRSLVLSVGCFDERIRQHEDWDLWLRVASTNPKVEITDSTFAIYRRMPLSNSSTTEGMDFTFALVLSRALRMCRQGARKESIRQRCHVAYDAYLKKHLIEHCKRGFRPGVGAIRKFATRVPLLPILLPALAKRVTLSLFHRAIHGRQQAV